MPSQHHDPATQTLTWQATETKGAVVESLPLSGRALALGAVRSAGRLAGGELGFGGRDRGGERPAARGLRAGRGRRAGAARPHAAMPRSGCREAGSFERSDMVAS